MKAVNDARGLTPPERDQSLLKRFGETLRGLCAYLGRICRIVAHAANQARIRVLYGSDQSLSDRKSKKPLHEILLSRLESDQLPWTMDTAFYALCSGAVLVSDCGTEGALTYNSLLWLAQDKSRARCLLPLQRAALQDPSKASGLAKMITCTQALWFCSQCIARLCSNMAISLLELNTFAHCISAFCIYLFWWHKPYEVQTQVRVNNTELYQLHLWHEASMQVSVNKSGIPRAAHKRNIRLTIYEKNSDESLTPLGSMQTDEYETEPYGQSQLLVHKIGPGQTVPGTEFVLYNPDMASGDRVVLTNEALEYFQKLSHLKSAWGLQDQILPLDISNSFYHDLCRPRIRNWNPYFANIFHVFGGGWPPLITALTVFAYGGMHLLAWQYHLRTRSEGTAWRIASVFTASSGLIIPVKTLILASPWHRGNPGVIFTVLTWMFLHVFFFAAILARSFLVVESFVALPNSPASVYEIPNWAAYIPHV